MKDDNQPEPGQRDSLDQYYQDLHDHAERQTEQARRSYQETYYPDKEKPCQQQTR